MTDVLFKNALVLDTIGGELLADRHVLVEGNRIKEVADRPIDAGGARTIELGGKVLMPGLVDGHVHVIAATPDFAAMLRWSPSTSPPGPAASSAAC